MVSVATDGGGVAVSATCGGIPSGLAPVSLPSFQIATRNPLISMANLNLLWATDSEQHDSETLAKLQRDLIRSSKGVPELGYFRSSQLQVPEAQIESVAPNTPIVGKRKANKQRYKNNKHKRNSTAPYEDYDEDIASLTAKKRMMEKQRTKPEEFMLQQPLCHLDEAKTRFAAVVKARAREKFLTDHNLWPQRVELQAPPFVGLEWDGQPQVIQYNRVFAEQVSHEFRPDGYYHVRENVYEELDLYAASFECSDEDADDDRDGDEEHE